MKHIHILGHTGCSKCKAMLDRTEKLLAAEPYHSHFVLQFDDTEADNNEAKIIANMWFCLATEVNRNQDIPCLLVANEENLLMEQSPKLTEKLGNNALLVHFGLKTDYKHGDGVVRPEMIKAVLDAAMEA